MSSRLDTHFINDKKTMLQRPRILLIEDDQEFRRLFEHAMRDTFFTVSAESGLEGFSRAISLSPELIVLDIDMQGWDGIETLKRIRAHHRLSHIPVMMLTANDCRKTALEALDLGADGYVLKTTFEPGDVRKRLLGLLPKPITVI